MSPTIRDTIKRQLDEADGYLTLNLPQKALEILERRADWATMQFEASSLTGEALCSLERYREALKPLEVAAGLQPGNLKVAIALGWCYKRTQRLAQAIDSLERAARYHTQAPQPLLHYNLACYWSLAANTVKALDELAIALKHAPELRSHIPTEHDFDSLRGNTDFERLIADPASLA